MEGRPRAPDDVLAALAATPPRQYLQRSDAGVSVLQALYQQCVGAGLASEHTSDDIARLHGLWDVALEHGLGSLVLDYVHDVCSDRLLTSSDPVEAFLLDGECVRRWCQKSVTISKGRVTSWLGRGLGFIHSSGEWVWRRSRVFVRRAGAAAGRREQLRAVAGRTGAACLWLQCCNITGRVPVCGTADGFLLDLGTRRQHTSLRVLGKLPLQC